MTKLTRGLACVLAYCVLLYAILLSEACAAKKPATAPRLAKPSPALPKMECGPVAFTADALREPTIVVCRWPDGRVRVWKWQ